MANSDKNIKITPNIGATSVPVIEFVGQGSQSMFLRVLDGSTASLAFEASEGQLFSITNNLSQGTIFSVNDISGIPFIELDASGTVSLNRFTGNTGIGTGLPTTKLEVAGTISGSNLFTNRITASSITSTNIIATTLTSSTANIATLTGSLTATNVSITNLTSSTANINTLTGSLTATNVSITNLTASIGAIARITGTNIFTNILTASQVTAYGNLIAQNGQVHIGNSLGGDSWTRIQHTSSDAYGFNWTYDNATVIVNEEGSINQALVLGDTNTSSVGSGLFGISYSENNGISWTPKLNLYGNGNLYVGLTGSSLVWNADNDGTGSTLDADLLDGQHGTYYLNYTNITNKPTISDVTININSGAGLTGSGSFTLNQTTTASITLSHSDTSTVADVATASGVFVSGLTFDTYGHVIGVNTGSGGGSAFGTISVSGQNALVAASSNDILTVAAGTNITLSTDNITKTLTINASSGGTAASAFGVIAIAGQDTVSADDPGDTLTFVAGNGIILTSSATIDFITIGTNGTSSNVTGALVLRDASGGFSTSNIIVTALTGSIGNIATLTGSLTATNVSISTLTSSNVNILNLSNTNLTSSTGNITTLTNTNLSNTNLTSSTANITTLINTNLSNTTLTSSTANISTLTGSLTATNISITNLTSSVARIATLTGSLTATNVTISTLTSSNVNILNLSNTTLTSSTANITTLTGSLTATNVTVTNLTSSIARIATLTGSLTATNVTVTNLTSSIAAITRITGSNIFTNTLTASANIFVGTGSLSLPSLAPFNNVNTGIYFPTADTIGFVEGGVESARLDSSGNFGLGTTNPSERLMIVSSSTNDIGIGVYNSTAYGAGNIAGSFIQLGKQESTVKQPMAEISGNPEVDNDSTPGMMLFKTRQGGSLSEKMRIRASGNVGIGTGTPSQKLEVVGTISATAFISTVASGTAPFTVSSTTSVVNLNADLLDGQHGSYYTNRDVGSIVYSYKNFGGAL